MIVAGRFRPVLGGSAGFRGAPFFLPLGDAGSGAVNTTLNRGTGPATFTRATTATTISSAGLIIPVASGVPRSWYWPDGTYGGYLPEGARTNLCLQSEAFATTWTQNNTAIAVNNAVSPDGASTADTITGAAGTVFKQAARQTFAGAFSGAHTFSCFVKAGTHSVVQFLYDTDATPFANFDLSDQTTGGNGTAVIESYPNGWYRLSHTYTHATANGFYISLVDSTAATRAAFSATTGTIMLWGAQIEAGSFASSYIPTTTASVTRNADVLTYVFAGNADATQGTAYAELGTEWSTTPSVAGAVGFDANGHGMNVINTGAATTIRVEDGTASIEKTGLTSMATASRKRAASWGGSTMSVTGDGVIVSSIAFDGDIGSTSIAIGCLPGGANQWFGPIKNVAIWKHQFADGSLQNLTA